jgi:hypothetical protein
LPGSFLVLKNILAINISGSFVSKKINARVGLKKEMPTAIRAFICGECEMIYYSNDFMATQGRLRQTLLRL